PRTPVRGLFLGPLRCMAGHLRHHRGHVRPRPDLLQVARVTPGERRRPRRRGRRPLDPRSHRRHRRPPGPRRLPPRDLTTHHRDAPPTMKRCDVGLMRTAPTHARHIAERDPVGAARAGQGRTAHAYRTAGRPLPRPGATSPNTGWTDTLRPRVPLI